MAYTKTTWNNLSDPPINAENLNKIEQGIYDNSLGIDKINPSGTATTTAEIEEGQITDVIGFKSLKLKGQTSQYTTQGNNLLNDEATKGIKIETGFPKPNMPITLTQGTYIYRILFTDSTYVNQNWNLVIALYDTNGTQVKSVLGNSAFEITSSEASSITQARVISNDTGISTYNGRVIKGIMFNSGSTAQEYELYTGGKASPNPDFPQDVNNVSGENVIGISNKNINSSTLEVGNISNGANITDTNVVRSKDYIMVTPSTAYTFSINGTANKVIVSMYDENKVFLTNDRANGYASSNGKFTTYSNAKYIRYRSYSADKSLFESGNIQIEKGSTATSYIAHQGNNFEINLGTIELCKIGTYQDYIYKKDGKWYKHKAVQKIKLDGSETYVLDAELTTVNRFRLNITSYKMNNIASTNSGMCNQLKIANAYSQDDEHLYSYNTGSNTWLYLFYNKTRCADISGLQTWLSANNLIIYGILNTPIEEEITYAPLLRQLDELYNSGLYDETNISQDNSSEAFILDLEACKNNINGIIEYIRR